MGILQNAINQTLGLGAVAAGIYSQTPAGKSRQKTLEAEKYMKAAEKPGTDETYLYGKAQEAMEEAYALDPTNPKIYQYIDPQTFPVRSEKARGRAAEIQEQRRAQDEKSKKFKNIISTIGGNE